MTLVVIVVVIVVIVVVAIQVVSNPPMVLDTDLDFGVDSYHLHDFDVDWWFLGRMDE